ncbi:MAG: DUF3822 family protein [Bacteroidia bacterium]|nr:DUF3822 family protein [Bacteroidia bacterium]
MEDTSSGYFYAFTLKNGFYNEAVFALNYELLAFRQTFDEGIAPHNFEPINHHCSSVSFLYTPQHFEIIPAIFKGAGVLNPMNPVNESELDFFGNTLLLRNEMGNRSISNKGQITEISVTDLLMKLVAKSLLECTTTNSIFVFRKEDGFHLILLQKNKLLFANSFDFTAYEEVLYFCLNILKDYGIRQEECSLVYSETEYSESASNLWKPYFANVITIEKQLKLPNYQGSAPFDLQEFSLLFQLPQCV